MRLDFPLPLTLRHSPRAKHLRLVVKASGAELVVPPGVSEAQALQFLNRHREWAERKRAELQSRALVSTVPTQRLASGASLPFQGREVPLVISEAAGRRTRIDFDGRFLIAIPPAPPEQTEQQARAALFAWIKVWLHGEAGRIAAQHAECQNLRPRAIHIKRLRSRWGSCGPQGDINLNWLLAFAPPTVLEYVVVHELCHILQRDHSPRFWDLVARHLPGWRQERQWLKRNGAELLRRLG